MVKNKPNYERAILIKHLIELGWTDTAIAKVVKTTRSYIYKIRTDQLHRNTYIEDGENFPISEENRRRLIAAEIILQQRELPSPDFEQDVIYIHLLRHFGVPKENIYKLYSHMTKASISRELMRRDIDLFDFKPELLGIDSYAFFDLMID